jgi:hypothetical protein
LLTAEELCHTGRGTLQLHVLAEQKAEMLQSSANQMICKVSKVCDEARIGSALLMSGPHRQTSEFRLSAVSGEREKVSPAKSCAYAIILPRLISRRKSNRIVEHSKCHNSDQESLAIYCLHRILVAHHAAPALPFDLQEVKTLNLSESLHSANSAISHGMHFSLHAPHLSRPVLQPTISRTPAGMFR